MFMSEDFTAQIGLEQICMQKTHQSDRHLWLVPVQSYGSALKVCQSDQSQLSLFSGLTSVIRSQLAGLNPWHSITVTVSCYAAQLAT